MSGAQSISTRRAYGVQRVCRVWHCARSSVYARRQATPSPAPCRRRGPVGAAPDDVLVAHVRRVLEASPFHGEGYRKVWVKLRVEGRRTSKERVRRLMREHDLQAPQRAGHAHGPKAHDGTITTEAPDVMWGTDMTATVTVAEGPAFVFVAVDHCTAECIGLHAAKRGTRFEALEPIRQGIRERFGGIGEGVARGLRLRHDHGSNYLADDFQQEVAFFGIESSPSFVREPEGNGVAERFIRTLKENLLWVRSFATIEALRLALLAVQADIQRTVDAGEIRLSKPRPGATRPRRAGRGSVEANTVKPLSKNPGAVQNTIKSYGIRKRVGEDRGLFQDRKTFSVVVELTSRVPTNMVAETRRRLGIGFHDRTQRVDCAIATNMISVGLDIQRLGLMVRAWAAEDARRVHPGHKPRGSRRRAAGACRHAP